MARKSEELTYISHALSHTLSYIITTHSHAFTQNLQPAANLGIIDQGVYVKAAKPPPPFPPPKSEGT